MRLSRILIASSVLVASALPACAYMHARRGPTSPSLFKKRSSKSVLHSSHIMGPRAMDAARATEIQTALIKSGYLSGTPSGRWDSESESAMQRLQGANGWQTKLTPDSRALILLGLGPNSTPNAGTAPRSTSLSENAQQSGQAYLQTDSSFPASLPVRQ